MLSTSGGQFAKIMRIEVRGLAAPAAAVAGYVLAAAPAVVSIAPGAGTILLALALGACLVALTIIDLRVLRLPDVLTLPLLGIGLATSAAHGGGGLVWSGAGALLGGLSLFAVAAAYRALRGRDGLGLGDVKLFAASGSWVGVEGLASVLLVACASALIVVAALLVSGRELDRQSAVPFGPFLAFGLWVVWLYGPFSG